MTNFNNYAARFANIRMRREDGILEMTLHSDDGPLLWNDVIHEELPEAFYAVGHDVENKVVILTGAGDAFCPGPDPNSFHFDGSVPPVALDKIYREGKALIRNLVNISVPMIAAVNGAAHGHSELALFCDIVLAADHATFHDPHLKWGIVPGDGIHIAYPMAFGMNRGRYIALTGAVVTAQQALDWGAVAEVMPLPDLHERAWDIARSLARQPILGLRYTREVLTREIQRQLHENLSLGLALEGFAAGYGAWGTTMHDDEGKE